MLAAAGGEGGGALPPAARAEILRAVDGFVMTLPLGATPGGRGGWGGEEDWFGLVEACERTHVLLTHSLSGRLPSPFNVHQSCLPPTGDAEIEEAVASRLYRAELGAAEARAKLGDW